MQTREVVILSGVRTAIGSYGGSLKNHSPANLASQVVAEAVKRSAVLPEQIGHCVFGNVIHTEAADMYLSRVAALGGGLPESVPALNVNRLCGSGLQAVVTAAQQIQLGLTKAVVAGGAESMSRAPYHLPKARFGQRLGDGVMTDPMVGALRCPFNHYHMGITAENVAERFNISRAQQDELALLSHNRAEQAIKEGRFSKQILPVALNTRKGSTLFDTDEHVRYGCRLENLSGLRPAFKDQGSVTAGNASGLNDGAAALVMMDREQAELQGLRPLARLVDYGVVALEPAIMGMAPEAGIRQLLQRNGLGVNDIDLYEINEAFAAQAVAIIQRLELPVERVNPNGSGIAMGHPIGATGAILVVKAIHELQRSQGRYAIISLCIGGGQGITALLERP